MSSPSATGLAKGILGAVSRTPFRLPALEAVAGLAGLSALPREKALAAMRHLLKDRADPVVVQKRLRFGAARWKMRLNLKYQLSRELFLWPFEPSDPMTLELFQRLSVQSAAVLDVGANIGLFSCVAAASNPACAVYAFEPMAELCELIRVHSVLNGWEKRLSVQARAVAESEGTREFFESDNDLEGTLMGERRSAANAQPRYQVAATTLDRIFEEKKLDPSSTLVKIDVEGAERLVIEGFKRTLSGPRKPELIFEILGESLKAGLIETMTDYGYQCRYIHRRQLIPVRSISDLEGRFEMGFHNFYFSQKEPLA